VLKEKAGARGKIPRKEFALNDAAGTLVKKQKKTKR